ncbi:ABC transporter substrate-binding protein [Streptomyces zingiberis]|uniref:ABC transporter substrate-binding protein n=1 Tax=Streptomyces zingiberis TaxID=2053010 RepID=A0ABX1BW34_9ACTN|nr:ABC transporter substrate-binding protein [Streptomyces zingiberis]NJQ00483.1 ABC transporter substrate-binding protein [Streptomyces zingiberis]
MNRRLHTLGLCTAVLLGLTACADPAGPAGPAGSPEKGSSASAYPKAPKVSVDEDIAAMLPDDVRSGKRISVAMNSGIPPIKFQDSSGRIRGFNPQLLEAAGGVLGLKVNYQEVPFDSLVPGLESGRYDLIASVGDFEERRARTDFIDYMTYGNAIMVGADFEQSKLTPDDLCGLQVAFTRGTAQQGLVEKAAGKCAADGKDELVKSPMKDANAGVLAVQSGQADAVWSDSPAMIYNATMNPDLYKVVYEQEEGPYGIGVHKDNGELRDALRAALRKLAKDGVYDELISGWGIEKSAALPDFPINTGPSQD